MKYSKKGYSNRNFSLLRLLKLINRSQWIVLGVALVSYLMWTQLTYEPLLKQGLILLVATAVLWLTQALHITVTALMIPVAASLMGILEPQAAGELFQSYNLPVFRQLVIATTLQAQKLISFS